MESQSKWIPGDFVCSTADWEVSSKEVSFKEVGSKEELINTNKLVPLPYVCWF